MLPPKKRNREKASGCTLMLFAEGYAHNPQQKWQDSITHFQRVEKGHEKSKMQPASHYILASQSRATQGRHFIIIILAIDTNSAFRKEPLFPNAEETDQLPGVVQGSWGPQENLVARKAFQTSKRSFRAGSLPGLLADFTLVFSGHRTRANHFWRCTTRTGPHSILVQQQKVI